MPTQEILRGDAEDAGRVRVDFGALHGSIQCAGIIGVGRVLGQTGPHPLAAFSKIIAVNLYAGNEYWLSAGATEKAKKLTVDVFDETGAPVAAETFNSGTKAAAGFSVTNSGQYFVRVRLEEGEAAGVCFLYSYK